MYVCCSRDVPYCTGVSSVKIQNKAPSNFVVPESISARDKQWICKTHHNALKQGLLPSLAKANNSHLMMFQ